MLADVPLEHADRLRHADQLRFFPVLFMCPVFSLPERSTDLMRQLTELFLAIPKASRDMIVTWLDGEMPQVRATLVAWNGA